jgi:hypothetical protein
VSRGEIGAGEGVDVAVPERPRAVAIVGWLSVVLAVLFMLAGVTSLGTIRHAGAGAPGFVARPVVSLVFGLVMLAAAIQFLRLREGGRKTLVGVYWFGLAYVIFFAAWDIVFGAPVIAGGRRGTYVLAVSLLVIFAAIQLLVIGLILSALRSQEVRRAMRS